jgi:phosphatidylinositol alpha-mannosyltransferase
MRIVQVCPYDMGRHGGVQAHIADLSAWLRANGHAVRIVAPPPTDGRAVTGIDHAGKSRRVTVHGTLTEICHVPRGELKALTDDLTEWGADLLHLHTPWTPLLPWQVWRAMRLPAIATFHATLPGASAGGPLARALRAAASYYARRLDGIVVPSTSPLQHLKSFPGAPAPVVLPPTVDLSGWREAARHRAEERPARNVVFLGRFEARKGVDVLLDAWPRVIARRPDMVLTIAGGGALGPRVEAAAAAAPGAIRHVREPSADEARKLVADAGIFVAPSPYGESFGIVLIEAMAAGAVPVAAANSGYSTVLTGPGAELLVPPGDAAALADRIVGLAGDPERLGVLRAWGKHHALTFSVEAVGPGFVEAYENALRRRR